MQHQDQLLLHNRTYIIPSKWKTGYKYKPCILLYGAAPIPLQNIKYDVMINNGQARVMLTQTYKNNYLTPINVTYQFPINDEVVFSKLQAIFQNRVIDGQIKEKNQAKAEYLANKAVGNTVAYAEALEETEDIMNVELGNFPPQEELKIIFTYQTTLDVINDVNWGFRIPAALTPRYNPDIGTTNSIANKP